MIQQQLKEYVVGIKTRNAQPHILNSGECILSSPQKNERLFLIDNIHRSSEVSRVQTSPISLDRDYSFEKSH